MVENSLAGDTSRISYISGVGAFPSATLFRSASNSHMRPAARKIWTEVISGEERRRKWEMTGDQLIPAVTTQDLKCVWKELRKRNAPDISVCSDLLARECKLTTANAMASAIRAMIIDLVIAQGLINEFTDGDDIQDVVFERAASVPLHNGVNGFDLESFVATLKRL
jgi:hypothetical protein